MAAVNFNTIQADVLAYLASIPLLENVFLYAMKPRDLQSQVNKALSGLHSTNGKSGASVEISKPFLIGPMQGAPGPTAKIEMRFLVKVQPTINNGANGTGLSAEVIDSAIVQALLEWGAEGSQSGSFFPAPNFSSPAQFGPDDPFEGRLVIMHAQIAFTPLPRTVSPVLSGSAAAVTITVAAPDNAAPILYTTDGTCPGYVQGTTNPAGTTQVYAAPFAVGGGTVVRSMAVAAGKLPSIVNYSIVT